MVGARAPARVLATLLSNQLREIIKLCFFTGQCPSVTRRSARTWMIESATQPPRGMRIEPRWIEAVLKNFAAEDLIEVEDTEKNAEALAIAPGRRKVRGSRCIPSRVPWFPFPSKHCRANPCIFSCAQIEFRDNARAH